MDRPKDGTEKSRLNRRSDIKHANSRSVFFKPVNRKQKHFQLNPSVQQKLAKQGNHF